MPLSGVPRLSEVHASQLILCAVEHDELVDAASEKPEQDKAAEEPQEEAGGEVGEEAGEEAGRVLRVHVCAWCATGVECYVHMMC